MWLVSVAVVSMLLLAAGITGGSAVNTMSHTTDRLWQDLSVNLSERTTSQTLRFLEPAVPFAELSRDLVRQQTLDLNDDEALLTYLFLQLQVNDAFTWASFGRADGTYLAAYRWPTSDGNVQYRRTTRRVVGPKSSSFHEELWEDGRWRVYDAHVGLRFYDPRIRPWYTAVADLTDGRWVDPYYMLSRQQPAVAYAAPVRNDDGDLLGVFTAEFEIAPLSDFLATLEVGRTGRVYLLDEATGSVVGHPEGDFVAMAGANPRLFTASEHPDEMLSLAWKALMKRDDAERWTPFATGDNLVVASRFPEDMGIPWIVLTVVPSDDFFGATRSEARRAVLATLNLILVAMIVSLLLSRAVAGSIREIQGQMERIATLELDHEGGGGSWVAEVNQMAATTEQMRQGLRAFARYVPHELVREVLASGQEAVLGAERKELTVLFSDIEGFTTLAEATPPDVILEALGAYLDRMNTVIEATDGTVCEYLGDGILAFWGAPTPQDDHAVRTCRAALAMKAASDDLEARARARGGLVMRTRIGISSGEVMVGNIGASERFKYGILGDTVNATSRLEGLNKVYKTQLLVGARTVELAGDAMVFRRLDTVLLKGKRAPIAVYELVCETDQLTLDREAALARFEQGRVAYATGQFAEAVGHFEAVEAASLSGDPAAEVLRHRCERYRDDPPTDWDGIFVMSRK